jgi:hypothetical protein
MPANDFMPSSRNNMGREPAKIFFGNLFERIMLYQNILCKFAI